MSSQPSSRQVPDAIRDTVIWLQEQMTEARDMLTRLQQESDQSLGRVGALQADLQEMRERAVRQEREISAAMQLRAEVREARETAAQLRERHAEFGQRVDESILSRETDLERERQARTLLSHRIDEVSRLVDAWDQRLNVIEEAQKQYHQNLFALRQHVDEIDAVHRDLDGRTATLTEAIHRLDTRTAFAEEASESLKRSDEGHADRLRLAVDQLRRVEARIETELVPRLESVAAIEDDVRVVRAERERWETQVQRAEARVDDFEARANDQIGMAQRFLVRAEALDQRLAAIEEQLTQFREETEGHLLQLGQTQERQKRRQVEDLEREIRELKQYATRLTEE